MSPPSGKNKRFSLTEVTERSASAEAERLGALLGASPAWIGPFIVFLRGLNFRGVPSMTPGATMFEAATHRDERGREIIAALDDLYRELRDGAEARVAHGEILERFIWHAIGEQFPGRLGACALEVDSARQSNYSLDAATGGEPPAAGVEAKTTTRALTRAGGDQSKARAKASWVLSLRTVTDNSIAGVFVTWSVEEDFRRGLAVLVGEAAASEAPVVAHEQLAQLPRRLVGLVRQLNA